MSHPETSLRDLIGEQFGPYKLVRRLGIGGMAETFEAIRSGPRGFEQRVCLKLVLPFFHQDENFIELFHREAKLAARLRHSNIVGVIDFGEADGRSYMALELVDGCDLQTLLDTQDRKRISSEYVALIGLDLAAALEHAHNPGTREAVDESGSYAEAIVHRDISPSNVLISRHGEIMLTDFGVAKAISGTARKQSSVKGKIPYMSPEQLKGEAIDGRADLFALGVVLFEALSGRRPYEGANDPATILLILNGEHPSLRTLAPDAPEKLCEVIESLVEPDAQRRPQSAVEVTELLDDFTPSQRIRRKLGKIVGKTPKAIDALIPDVSSAVGDRARESSVSDGPPEETGVGRTRRRAADPEAPTVPTPGGAAPAPKDAGTPVRSETKSRRRALAMIAGLALAVVGVVGAGLLWPAQEDETSPAEATPPAEPTDVQEQVEAQAKEIEAAPPAEPVAPAEPTTTESRPKAPPPAPASARLTVIVFPWGSVWINGKREGAAPVKNKSMKPGRYRIGAGKESPSKTQTVHLRPGQRRTVQFDLTSD